MDWEIYHDLSTRLQNIEPLQLSVIIVLVLLIWFLPTLIALMLGRKKLKFIAAANCASLLSHFLWFALLVWVVSGNVVGKRLNELINRHKR